MNPDNQSKRILLSSEIRYIDVFSSILLDELYNQIRAKTFIPTFERLLAFMPSSLSSHLIKERNLLNIDNDQLRTTISSFFNTYIIDSLYGVIFIGKNSSPIGSHVGFKPLSSVSSVIARHIDEDSEEKFVELSDHKTILGLIKKYLKSLILAYYNYYQTYDQTNSAKTNQIYNLDVKDWYLWRNKQLSIQHMKNKLPELEGIF
jgi:hypothetical protein